MVVALLEKHGRTKLVASGKIIRLAEVWDKGRSLPLDELYENSLEGFAHG